MPPVMELTRRPIPVMPSWAWKTAPSVPAATMPRILNTEPPRQAPTSRGPCGHNLDRLKQEIDGAEKKVKEAERLGMEVRGPRFDLRQAFDALTNARTLVHTFKPGPMQGGHRRGPRRDVQREGTGRTRSSVSTPIGVYWLAASLIPILLVVGLLLAYIRLLQAQELTSGRSATPLKD